jgi:hypothetical protein
MRVNKESRWRCWKVLRSEPRPTFGHYGNYACRVCHRAHYLSQKQKTASRKRLSAAKLRLKLGGWPDIREPMPSKPK